MKRKIRELASTGVLWGGTIGAIFGIRGLAKGSRGSFDHIQSTISLFQKSVVVKGMPVNITIEPTNICNLKCPVCETGSGILSRQKHNMTLEQFKLIIDKLGPHINTLMFYFMGEPFLNQDSYSMISYAKDKGISFVETCTNGDLVKPDQLIDCGLDRVSFQIGGMTQETHQVYRINSRLDRVLSNLKETIKLKYMRNSKIEIECGLILMKHNEHEILFFKKYMSDIGATRAVIIDPCVRTIDQGKEMLPSDNKHWFYDSKAFDQGILKPKIEPKNVCPWIYYSMVIMASGDVVPCCRDPLGTEVMGNIIDQDISDIWNGEKFRNFRERITKSQRDVAICRLCSAYPPSVIK